MGLARSYTFSEGIENEAKYKGLSPTATLGMPQYMDTSGIPQLPSIELGSYTPAGASSTNIGTQPWSYLREGTETHELLGTVNWVKGTHDLKFGAEGRMHRTNFTQPGTPGGLFYFDFSGTSEFPASGGGDALASFMTGVGGPGLLGAVRSPELRQHAKFPVWGLHPGQLESQQEAHAQHRAPL